jgi:hypothetical protein
MSYDDAITYIFDNIERLIAEADHEPARRTPE